MKDTKLHINKKYVFILDDASHHKTYMIRNFLEKHSNVKVEFLPPYSPELNLIKTCWKNNKSCSNKFKILLRLLMNFKSL